LQQAQDVFWGEPVKLQACQRHGAFHAGSPLVKLDEYVLATADGKGHLDALATKLTAFGKHVRYASEQASELKDADTADLFTDIARGIDKWLWFVETSQQAGS